MRVLGDWAASIVGQAQSLTQPRNILINLESIVNRQEKQQVISEVKEIFNQSGVVVIAAYEGLTVSDIEKLRNRLREVDGKMRVVKNRLVSKAIADNDAIQDVQPMLKGMTALVYSESPSAAPKVVRDFAKENSKLGIIGGVMTDKVLDEKGVLAAAKLPSREELIAQIVGCITAPAANIASAVDAPASNIASILKTIEEKHAA